MDRPPSSAAVFSSGADVVVSFGRWAPEDLSEIRADTFASRYLMPPEVLRAIPEPGRWTPEKAQEWAQGEMTDSYNKFSKK